MNNKECRYCLSGEKAEKLIDPCLCEGTMRYVHQDCLEDWINNRGIYIDKGEKLYSTKCEICNYDIRYRKRYKYSIVESIIRLIKSTFSNVKNFAILIIHSVIIYYLMKRIRLFIKESLQLLKTKFKPSLLINISHNISILLSIILGLNDIYCFYNKMLSDKRKCKIEFLHRNSN
jgi:hypothetical protein